MQHNEVQMNPQQCAGHIAHMLLHAQQECRANIEHVNDPKAQALFETVAEMLGGTVKALEDYQSGIEGVWHRPPIERASTKPPRRDRVPEDLPAQQRSPVRGPQPPVVTDMAPDIDEVKPPPRLYTE